MSDVIAFLLSREKDSVRSISDSTAFCKFTQKKMISFEASYSVVFLFVFAFKRSKRLKHLRFNFIVSHGEFLRL